MNTTRSYNQQSFSWPATLLTFAVAVVMVMALCWITPSQYEGHNLTSKDMQK